MEAREERIRNVAKTRQEGIIVLEDIHDPHNAMAVVRTADAFGFQTIYVVFEREEIFNPKELGKVTSKSANKWIHFKTFKSTAECIKELKNEDYVMAATVLDKEAKPIEKADLKAKKMAVWFGNEHRGLSEQAIKAADEKIYIPMKGMVQSLNLSVTAGILMYEIDRRRKIWGEDNYRIEGEKLEKLSEEWVKKSRKY
ncbi:MAG TPA: RNA methyltransferase [Patescibacteria group bacterium]